MRPIRIGSGAGLFRRPDRARRRVGRARRPDYLGFECLAERTIALAQEAKLRDPVRRLRPAAEARMEAVLPACRATAASASSPTWAPRTRMPPRRPPRRSRDAWAWPAFAIAAVTGDDVLDEVREGDYALLERPGDRRLARTQHPSRRTPISASRRSSRRSAAAPTWSSPGGSAIRRCSWRRSCTSSAGRWTTGTGSVKARSSAICWNAPGQITGGYFADPGYKDVPDLARLGFPIARSSEDGSAVITKVEGSGGRISVATCKEQLLYELLDPAAYLQPDVTADFSAVRFVGGRARPCRG